MRILRIISLTTENVPSFRGAGGQKEKTHSQRVIKSLYPLQVMDLKDAIFEY